MSAASSEGHIVEDCAKLKADQAKTLRRAKDMLKAAFSEEDSSGSEEETSAEKATIVKKDPVVRAISDSDTDMQPQWRWTLGRITSTPGRDGDAPSRWWHRSARSAGSRGGWEPT